MTRIMGFTHDVVAAHGHEVEYFQAEEAAGRGVRGRWGRFTYPMALARFVRERARSPRPFDIVNVHEPSGAALVLSRHREAGPAIVATSHGIERRAWDLALEEARLGRAGPSLWSRLVYPSTSLWQSTLTLRNADHIFCLNEEDRRWLTRRFGPHTPSITRIGPGVDPGFASAAAARDYAGVDRLLFAGTWRTNKGIQDLIPAFATLAERHPSLTVSILGAGVSDDVVLAAWPEPLRDRVRCLRSGSDAETMRVFAEHDLFLLPSLFEGTPLTLIEAMGSGLPIVTTNTCGMKDVIRHEALGLLVPIRSPDAIVAAVERLREDRALRERLGKTAQAEALARYSWAQVAQPIVDAYEALVADRDARHVR